MAPTKSPKAPAKAKTKVVGKKEVVEQVATKTNISKKEALAIVKALFDVVKDNLKKGKTVRLIPFGNFEVRHRAGRKGRNPRTGKEIDIKARKVPAFRPGKDLKDAVK